MSPPHVQTCLPLSVAAFAAVISGLVAVYAYPPYGVWILIFLAYVLLLLALRGQGLVRGFLIGLLQGFTLYAISLWWLRHTFNERIIGAVGVWLAMALFCAGGAALVGWVSKSYPRSAWLPGLAAVTLLVPLHFRSEIFTAPFPWVTPGLALGPVFLTPYLGVYGCGFLVILACAFVVLGRGVQRTTGVALAILLAVAAVFRPLPVAEEKSPVMVMAVQGGQQAVSLPRPIFASSPEPRNFWNYWRRTVSSDFRGGIIVWPEAATTALRASDIKLETIKHLTRSRQAVFVIGTTEGIGDSGWFNEAITFEDGEEVGSHRKVCPVPFIETCTPGANVAPIKTSLGILGTPICYDTHLEAPMREMASAGAELFVVPSRDDLNWTATQHWQHAEILRHRALENDRWIAVANMHGISQIIDPAGNRVGFVESGAKELLRGSVYLRNGRTPYNLGLWLLPYLLTGACVISYGSLLIHRRRR